MSNFSRLFRGLQLAWRRRGATNTTTGAPTNLRPGELVVGETESALYYGKADGTTIELIGGGGGVGGGGGADTGDVTFSGVQVIGAGEGSGDGLNNGTLELVPDAGLRANDQYLVVDPTGPNHIHLRAGGEQDNSAAELIFGGEHAHVRVLDSGHQVTVRSASGGSTQIFELGAFRYTGGHMGADEPIPLGSTFVFGGVTYTVASVSFDFEAEKYAINVTPAPPDEPPWNNVNNPGPAGLYEFQVPFFYKDFTFSSAGQLSIPGSIRFPNNTVQVTAGMPFSRATGGNPIFEIWGNQTFSDAGFEFVRSTGLMYTPQAASVTLAMPAIGFSDVGEPTLTMAKGRAGQPPDSQLTISSSAITFSDGTAQGTAGVISVNEPEVASFVRARNIIVLSQADYNALTPNATTVYLIVG